MQDKIPMSSLKINKVDNAETFKQLKSSEYYDSEEVYVLEDYISSSDIASGIEVHNNDETAHEDIRTLANKKLNDEQVQTKIDEALAEISAIPVPENAQEGQILTYNGESWEAANGVTSVNGQTGNITLTANDISGVAKLSTKVDIILEASKWSNSQYTITNAAITATSIIEGLPPSTMTKDQLEAFGNALVIGSTQSNGSLTLKALGEVPTIDVPITLIIRGDM